MAAARAGASVVLVAAGAHVGGMLTGGLSRSDVERQEALIGGIAREVFERIAARSRDAHHPPDGRVAWRFEPHVAEAVLEEMLSEAGVVVLREHPLDAVRVDGTRVAAITTGDGCVVEAAVWIDASYEGDLLAGAGATWTMGREDRERYGERWAGRQELVPNPHQVRTAVDARADPGELLPRLTPYDALGPPGRGDGRLQSACYRLCLSRADDRLPLAAPPGYDRSRYALVERNLAGLVRDGARLGMHDVIGLSELPNGKADVNSHGPFSTNLPGAIQPYPEATGAERDAIEREHQGWAAGLLHFLSSDPAVPGGIRALLEPYGYPADEFADRGGWPHQLYIRDARRLIGEHVLTEPDLIGGRVPGDTIAMAGYNIDIREVQWAAVPISRFPDLRDEVLVEGYLSVPVAPYGIPSRSLIPRRAELANLLVSTCVSASAVAFASIRMEPTYLALGHAAGSAAAAAARGGTDVQDVDVDRLRAALQDAGQVLRPAR